MGGNQRQIPVIQNTDNNTTQIQQNSNKVLRNLSNNIDSLQTLVNQMNLIGEIKIANITLIQFQKIAGADWVLCDGSSCVDTAYSKLTGNNTVPNIALGSINNFIKVN